MKQPGLGIWSTIIVILLSATVCAWFKPETFGTIFTVIAIAGIPAQVILGLVWQNNYPGVGGLSQPVKGITLLLMQLIFTAIIAIWVLRGIGGGGPTPMAIFYMILSVPVALWCVAVFQCWPASAMKAHPAFVGLVTLIIIYIACTIIYYVGFNFQSTFGPAPFYPAIAALDPHGLFDAAKALTFAVLTVAVILACILLDFWPITSMIPKMPALGKQPLFGIVAGIWVLIISYILWYIFIGAMGMDVMMFQVKIAVCWIFGEFIMLVCLQTAPFQTTKQPGKGIALIICSIILAAIMWYLYAWLAVALNGALPSGPPAYVLELWVASAMLAVTFPMMNIYCGFFNSWPFSEAAPPPPPAGK